ncbi:HDOD domain-containing protein [Actimicrobium antarcticum]|uniref:HDOD domain-containing protein n=1 Tax=Actimicrobium antarcticum TaxID=1051899 RepID=A0ABP7TWB6_9BURK
MIEHAADPEQTLQLLWTRVRQRGDLPGFSKVVSAILGAMRGEDDRDFNMARTVLSDPALTQKVLRLANSPMYAVFGRDVNTVSKAVVVLGTDAIGHLALGVKLIDGLSVASADSALARCEMEKAVLSGHIGRQIASSASTRDAEEAVVCSMLHGLGRMMVAFYLPELWQQILTAANVEGTPQDLHARHVLGLGLDHIGRMVALQWGLPNSLVDTLKDVHPIALDEPLDHSQWLAAVSTMSLSCAEVLMTEVPGSAGLALALDRIADGYAGMLGVDSRQLLIAVEVAQQAARDEGAPASRLAKVTPPLSAADKAVTTGKPVNATALLVRGVADLGDISKSSTTGQLMSMALETLFNSLGLSHAALFQRIHKDGRYQARMCLGANLQDMAPRLNFDVAYQPDVFHAALANDKMIFVENARDPAFISKLPRWWKDAFPSVRSFVVMPLTVNRLPVGFLYGDWDRAVTPSRIDPAEIIPLNEMRALLVLALERQRQRD